MKLRGAINWICSIAPSVAMDISGLSGCGLIVYGAWTIYEPAGFIVAGSFLLAGVWFLARRK